MRSLIKILCTIALVVMASCRNDDNSVGAMDSMNGLWNLSNVSGGFAGVDVDYEEGLVLWNFNPGTSMLRVETGLIPTGPQSTFLPAQSGDYAYSIVEANGKKYLIIEDLGVYVNGEYGRIEINSVGDLIIDQSESSSGGAADVFLLSFIR